LWGGGDGGRLDPDLVEQALLPSGKPASSHEFEHGEKDTHHPDPWHIVVEQLRESDPPLLPHERFQPGDVHLDRRVVVNDLPRPAFLAPAQHP
jgi:hypothetical protein